MLHVGVEDDPGQRALCMVCALEVEQLVPTFYVIAWANALPLPPPTAVVRQEGGLLRLCWEHADELSRLLLEVL